MADRQLEKEIESWTRSLVAVFQAHPYPRGDVRQLRDALAALLDATRPPETDLSKRLKRQAVLIERAPIDDSSDRESLHAQTKLLLLEAAYALQEKAARSDGETEK